MGVNLSSQDMQTLKNEGYSDQEIREAVAEIEQEQLSGLAGKSQSQQANDPRATASHSTFQARPSDDIAKMQMELDDLLGDIEHHLRGDIVVYVNGSTIWKDNPTPEKNPLNKWGVQELMSIMRMYINRNSILSDYDQDQIDLKMRTLGKQLNNLFFTSFEEMGMDCVEKRKFYPILTKALWDVVHSVFQRALDGNERRSLREMSNVTYSNMINQQSQLGKNGAMPSSKSMINPSKMFGGL